MVSLTVPHDDGLDAAEVLKILGYSQLRSRPSHLAAGLPRPRRRPHALAGLAAPARAEGQPHHRRPAPRRGRDPLPAGGRADDPQPLQRRGAGSDPDRRRADGRHRVHRLGLPAGRDRRARLAGVPPARRGRLEDRRRHRPPVRQRVAGLAAVVRLSRPDEPHDGEPPRRGPGHGGGARAHRAGDRRAPRHHPGAAPPSQRQVCGRRLRHRLLLDQDRVRPRGLEGHLAPQARRIAGSRARQLARGLQGRARDRQPRPQPRPQGGGRARRVRGDPRPAADDRRGARPGQAVRHAASPARAGRGVPRPPHHADHGRARAAGADRHRAVPRPRLHGLLRAPPVERALRIVLPRPRADRRPGAAPAGELHRVDDRARRRAAPALPGSRPAPPPARRALPELRGRRRDPQRGAARRARPRRRPRPPDLPRVAVLQARQEPARPRLPGRPGEPGRARAAGRARRALQHPDGGSRTEAGLGARAAGSGAARPPPRRSPARPGAGVGRGAGRRAARPAGPPNARPSIMQVFRDLHVDADSLAHFLEAQQYAGRGPALPAAPRSGDVAVQAPRHPAFQGLGSRIWGAGPPPAEFPSPTFPPTCYRVPTPEGGSRAGDDPRRPATAAVGVRSPPRGHGRGEDRAAFPAGAAPGGHRRGGPRPRSRSSGDRQDRASAGCDRHRHRRRRPLPGRRDARADVRRRRR